MKALNPHQEYHLPEPRTKIEALLWELDDASSNWYMTRNPEYIKHYHDLFYRLRSLGWNGIIDIDSQLPHELMPQPYLDETADFRTWLKEQSATPTTK